MSGSVEFKNGSRVTFNVGRSKTEYTAKVTGRDGQFLVTVDDAGNERRVRPGSCRAA